jgi:hypothetical protein
VAFDFDIRSAYIFQAAQLLDVRRGEWRYSEQYEPEAYYGFARCEVNIESDFSPVLVTLGEGDKKENYAPKGIFETTLEKHMIDFINERELGYTTILSGWWWFPDKTRPAYHPLAGMANWLYQKRMTAQGLEKQIIKGMMVGSLYGIFLQRKGDKPGEHYFSPYAAIIESECRIQVVQKCLENNIVPLAIAVDGIVTDKPLPCPNPDVMGEWRLSHQGKCIIVSSALVCFEGKEGEGDFSLSYDWLVEAIKHNPDSRTYSKSKASVVTLGVAVNENRIEDLGKVEVRDRPIFIGGDKKRLWNDNPTCGGDLLKKHYKSESWDIDLLKMMVEKS